VSTVPTEDDTALAVWSDLVRLHATVTDLLGRELVEGGGIAPGWYDVLAHLELAGGRLRMQELAAAVALSKSGLSRLIDRLETKGYVARVSCPSDRRGTFAEITATGRAVLQRIQPLHVRAVAQHLTAHLDAASLASFGRTLRTLLEANGAAPTGHGDAGAGGL
jgi:DNA-binding MarR family transcriptional regulator